MKNVIILILITGIEMYSQGSLTATTDKSAYLYGEIMEISVSYINNTDSTLLFRPECGRSIWIEVNEFEFIEQFLLADGCEKYFAPNEGEIWKFNIDPDKHGYPVTDGLQTVYAFGYNLNDSIKFAAPKYYGGTIRVHYYNEKEKQIRDELFNSIDATVVYEFADDDPDEGDELWSVRNASIDSLIIEHRIRYELPLIIEHFPYLEEAEIIITDLNVVETSANKYSLNQNYPNPFNPKTTIDYSIAKEGIVKLIVYDILGCTVKNLVREYQTAGDYKIEFDASQLPSGIYLYRLSSGSYSETKKLILLK